jgi:hypothetical protein
MFIVPEARTAILRITLEAAVCAACIVDAIRTNSRWVRIPLVIAAVPLTVFVLFGIFVVSLIVQYGPR